MGATIQLLGSPAILRDGHEVPAPKGRKSWALLAYLLLAERPASRRQLAELLFADADDPLGALRWNLAQLRRALDGIATVEGDPVTLTLPPDVEVDVHAPAAGGELLEGMELAVSPAFESWLLVARGRYAGQAAAVLHEGALDALSGGNADRAAELAAQLVAVDPFDEQHHELLVRSLVARGDRAGALEQVEACRRLFRRELGSEPTPALRQAAGPARPGEPTAGNRAAAHAHLEAGEAALAAGAAEHGVGLLRQACAEAAACGDDAIHAHALFDLGSALVHAVRGRDEEGALLLHQAIATAEAAGDRETLVAALRELAYTDIQAGRRASVEERLARADRLATTDAEHAAILAMQGMNRSDMAEYPGALDALTRSADYAERAGEDRRAAFSLSLVGRAQLLRGEQDEALVALDRSLELVQAERWIAFLPWPETLRAEVDLARGETERAGERLQRAFAMACDQQDPCWEGMAARALGLVERAKGEGEASRGWMEEARTRCTRVPDRYVWVQGHVLDAGIPAALDDDDAERAGQLVRALGALAARTEMRELSVRGLVHAARLGDRGALASARVLADEIDNPALTALVGAAS